MPIAMAERVRNNIVQRRNQENVHAGVKSVVMGAPPAATKRSALEEIGNAPAVSRGAVAKKVEVGKLNAPLRKEKEEPVPHSKTVNKTTLKKAFSTSSIPKEVTTDSLTVIEDIDKDNKGDPFLVPEYVNDIYTYLREVEAKYPIKKNYLEGQEVTSKMRGVLIDWLVEVHQQFHLLAETLLLTVTIIDRYLQEVHTTTRKELQLVGVGAMFVASKYEEMFPPVVGDVVYICDNAYTKDEILRMEMIIVKTLNFSFSRPLTLHFLRRYSKAAHALPVHHVMAKYLLELCLVDYDMCHYPPSLVSAAAIYLALWLFSERKAIWTKTLAHYTSYSFKDIELVVRKVVSVVVKASATKNQAVNKKYAQSKFLKISCSPELKTAAFKKLAAS